LPIHGNGGHAAVVREIFSLKPEIDTGWIIAIGDNSARRKEAKNYDEWTIAIHPSAIVSPFARIGWGTVILEGAIVQAHAIVGAHCIINCGAVVTHDCTICDFAHIAPGVHLCGGVYVGTGALVGVGSCAIPGAKIEPWATIRAGSVIK